MSIDLPKTTNKPVVIMNISAHDGHVNRDTPINAKALPMIEGMEWFEAAEKLFSDYTETGTAQSLRAIMDCLLEYSEDWPTEAIQKSASGVQVVNAFKAILRLNDPLAEARAEKQAQEEAETDRNMKKLEAAEKIMGKDKLQEMVSSKMSSVLGNGSDATPSES